jgi:hypothetical protein
LAVGAEMAGQAAVGLLDRLMQLAGARVDPRRRQRARQPPVGVHPTAAPDQQLAGPLGQERVQPVEPAGPVDVDPQPARVRDVLLVARPAHAAGHADEALLARLARRAETRLGVGAGQDPRGVLERPLKPARIARGRGQKVLAAFAPVDQHRPAGRASARRNLDKPVRLAVQHPQVDRAMPRCGQLT